MKSPITELKEYAVKVDEMEYLHDPGDVINKLLTLISKLPSGEGDAVDGWISVEDRPLFTKDENDIWTLTNDGEKDFIAAVPYNDATKPNENNLWWIRHCIIDDGGLKVVGDDDNEPAGWSLTDVTHYIPFSKPPSNSHQVKTH